MSEMFMGEEVDESTFRRSTKTKGGGGLAFFAVGFAAFVVGLLIGGFLVFSNQRLSTFDLSTPQEWLIFSVLMFLGCALFFGRISFLIAGLGGVMAGHVLEQSIVRAGLALIPLLFCGYAGTLIGQKLGDDFAGRDNVFDYSRAIVLYLGIGLISAIAASFVAPLLPFSGAGLSQMINGLGW